MAAISCYHFAAYGRFPKILLSDQRMGSSAHCWPFVSELKSDFAEIP